VSYRQAHEYVAASNKELKRLLATKAPPKTPGVALPGAAAAPKNDLDEFKVPPQPLQVAMHDNVLVGVSSCQTVCRWTPPPPPPPPHHPPPPPRGRA